MIVTVEDALGWPVYTIAPVKGESERNLVYLHGGGWVNEIARQHWQLAGQIAAEAQIKSAPEP